MARLIAQQRYHPLPGDHGGDDTGSPLE
jgi:hypothetical protein